ncbi:MAG: sodium:proton antiporter [Pseudomonadota bacterium]
MTLFQITALLIVLAGVFGAINYLVLRLPSAIGILVVSLVASFGVIGVDAIFPKITLEETIRAGVLDLEFSDTLLEGMLGLLLFAGALHVKVSDLRAHWPVILLMATIGVGISTAIAGVGFSWITGAPLVIAMIWGALISPTDPVAVMGVLRTAKLNKPLETAISGESLFNDGVGYVTFLLLVGLAFPNANAPHTSGFAEIAELFVVEALGGALLGIVLGFLTFRLMRQIDERSLGVLLTLGLAFGGYELAVYMGVSGPIAAVCAALMIGDVGPKHGMSEETRSFVDSFWGIIDEILNAILFLMIGIEVFAITFSSDFFTAGVLAIGLSLLARFLAVVLPIILLRPFQKFSLGAVAIMTWGGLKGGVSVALVLSMPDSEWKPIMLACTYMVVIFTIVVQGLTVAPLARKLGPEPELV